MVAVEAALRGIPVVSTDLGGLPEANFGECLVPSGSALLGRLILKLDDFLTNRKPAAQM